MDTSALMAILQNEPAAEACTLIIENEPHLLVSAGNVAETMIVTTSRRLDVEIQQLIERLGFEVVPVTASAARRIGPIYRRWGKGFHPAALNFGDCFAYELATSRDCPLLFVGEDFSRTDAKRAL